MVTALRIDGKQMAADIRSEVAEGVAKLKAESNVTPGLVAVLVGDDPASAIYVRNKGIACEEAGMFSEAINLPADTTQADLLALVARLNEDARFHGVLVQLPLPPQIDERTVIQSINANKDVDGMHPISTGLLLEGNPRFLPATPAGVQQMLVRTGNDPSGKHVVIVGRSNIVGKPLALLLATKAPSTAAPAARHGCDATVTICHSRSADLAAITRQADILVAAVGRPKMITAEMVKPGAAVIDVGINRVDGRLVGDVDFDAVCEVAGQITPVPGGVGPLTVAMLLANTLLAAELRGHG